MQAGRLFLFLAAGFLVCGCAHQNSELLESELRARDFQMREAMDEMKRLSAQNNALRQEMTDLRQGSKMLPEVASAVFGLTRVVMARGTGGYDNDGLPGDEGVMVYLEPRDTDDHVIKVPGKVQIAALEINSQGLKFPLDTWEIDEEQMRQSWKQGFLSSGYQFVLPWKIFPQTENVRLVARLILPDGRLFEADKDIKVRLVPDAPHRPDAPAVSLNCDPFLTPTNATIGKQAAGEKGRLVTSNPPPANFANVQTANWEPAPVVIQLGQPISLTIGPIIPEPPLPSSPR